MEFLLEPLTNLYVFGVIGQALAYGSFCKTGKYLSHTQG